MNENNAMTLHLWHIHTVSLHSIFKTGVKIQFYDTVGYVTMFLGQPLHFVRRAYGFHGDSVYICITDVPLAMSQWLAARFLIITIRQKPKRLFRLSQTKTSSLRRHKYPHVQFPESWASDIFSQGSRRRCAVRYTHWPWPLSSERVRRTGSDNGDIFSTSLQGLESHVL
jgi:hypothetical protein